MRQTLFIIFLLSSLASYSASWTDPKVIYNDKGIKLEIQFKMQPNSCDPNATKANRYRYKISGTPPYSAFYVNWSIDYIDCNDNLFSKQNSVQITPNFNEGYIESQDYTFTCKSIYEDVHDVTSSSSSIVGGDVKARPQSSTPDSIEGRAKIYLGQQAILTVRGGGVGIGAQWVWYEGSCGTGQIVGRGKTITISPNNDVTVYSVRAEGPNGNTNCATKTITKSKESLPPKEILGKNKICSGESITLSQADGLLGEGAKWAWYEGSCGGKLISNSGSINVMPTKTTKYFVRAEGSYNTTACQTIEVSVFGKTASPTSLTAPQSICEGEQITITVNGGTLAGDATWRCNSGSCTGAELGKNKNK